MADLIDLDAARNALATQVLDIRRQLLALAINPPVEITRGLTTPQVRRLQAALRRRVESAIAEALEGAGKIGA